jgi:fatty-acyl-CoA synthase
MRAPFSRNLFDLLCEQADRYGDDLAVIAGTSRTSYSALKRRAAQVAGALRASGINRGDRVGLLIGNRVEWLEICFGAAALGAAVVPLSTWSKRREIDFLLSDSRIRTLFALDRFGEQDYAGDLGELIPELRSASPGTWHADRYPLLQAIVFLGSSPLPAASSYAKLVDGHAPLLEPPPPGEGARVNDDSFVLYTSGSTAYPKAVRQTQAAVIENGFNIGERQGLRPGDRVLLSLPLFWSYGSTNAMCATLTHGATLVLQSRFEPAEALDIIEREACTAIYTLPAITTALVTHATFRPDRTRTLRTGLTIGSPQDVVTAAQKLGVREICNVYGQTESYGNCCVTWHHWPLERRKHVQGPPLPGVRVRIVDPETGVPRPAGEIGAIEVTGYLTPGYDGTSKAQNEVAFTPDGYLRTGDLGRLTPEGDLQFAARDNEMIKRAGINIAPAEIEELLQQHPGVALAGVAGAPDPEKGELVFAFVIPTPGSSVDVEELRAHCRTLASSYKAPDRVEICAQLPVTPTGKLLRRELKEMAAALAHSSSSGG